MPLLKKSIIYHFLIVFFQSNFIIIIMKKINQKFFILITLLLISSTSRFGFADTYREELINDEIKCITQCLSDPEQEQMQDQCCSETIYEQNKDYRTYMINCELQKAQKPLKSNITQITPSNNVSNPNTIFQDDLIPAEKPKTAFWYPKELIDEIYEVLIQ